MPLSDHEQRMLDQIESALYAEDPKFASSVRRRVARPDGAATVAGRRVVPTRPCHAGFRSGV
jgi:hypothetical protein